MSLQIGYVPRNMSIRDNGSAKADIDESSKLKRDRHSLNKKGKTDNISSESTTTSSLKIIHENIQEIKSQEKMEKYIPASPLKAETKPENELNEEKKAKQCQNEKVKKRQLSDFKSLKQNKIENEVITLEESDIDNNGIDEIAFGCEKNRKGEETNGFTLTTEYNYERIIIKDKLIRRKRKAKKTSKSTTPDTSKAKLTNKTKKSEDQGVMENSYATFSSSKNGKKILSKKKNNSNSLKMEEENTKKKDDLNSGHTAFNQLINHQSAEKVVVTLSKSNFEENNKLVPCFKGLMDPLSFSDKKIETINGGIPGNHESVVNSLGEGDDIFKINFLSGIKPDDSQAFDSEFYFYQSEEGTLEDIKKEIMKNKKGIGPHYNKTKEGEIYKYCIYQLNNEGNIEFKCYDEKCNGRGIFDINLGEISITQEHDIKYCDHDYIVSLGKDDCDIKSLKESNTTGSQIFIYKGEKIAIKV